MPTSVLRGHTRAQMPWCWFCCDDASGPEATGYVSDEAQLAAGRWRNTFSHADVPHTLLYLLQSLFPTVPTVPTVPSPAFGPRNVHVKGLQFFRFDFFFCRCAALAPLPASTSASARLNWCTPTRACGNRKCCFFVWSLMRKEDLELLFGWQPAMKLSQNKPSCRSHTLGFRPLLTRAQLLTVSLRRWEPDGDSPHLNGWSECY